MFFVRPFLIKCVKNSVILSGKGKKMYLCSV